MGEQWQGELTGASGGGYGGTLGGGGGGGGSGGGGGADAALTAQRDLLEGVTWLPEGESPHHLYMGLGCLGPGRKVRRIDIKVYERRVFAFALLYFTGSDYFNRSLRLLVSKCGWTLSDRGLCLANRVKVVGGQGGWAKTWTSCSLACNSERDVLTACGVPWREPCDRDMEVIETDASSPAPVAQAGAGVDEVDAGDLVGDEEDDEEDEEEDRGGGGGGGGGGDGGDSEGKTDGDGDSQCEGEGKDAGARITRGKGDY